eukprot:gene8181-9058_t
MVTTLDHHEMAMAIKLLRNILILCLALLVAECESQEITTTSCGLTKACVKFPTSCGSSTDCDFLMTYKRKSTNENIMEFELSSKRATGYVALGFNQHRGMFGTKGEACYFGVGGSGQFKGFSLINYNPVFESVAANTVLASIESVNGAIVCRFSRPIAASGYQSSLGPSVYPIIATGALFNGTPDYHSSTFSAPIAMDLTTFLQSILFKLADFDSEDRVGMIGIRNVNGPIKCREAVLVMSQSRRRVYN